MAQDNLNVDFRPTILAWNRLEGQPRTKDFERSLRAEVRDPLWMLCRQWQFGEFDNTDGGSAMTAKIQLRSAHLNRYAARSLQADRYDDELPLETKVEHEAIPFDLMTRARLGRHWLKLIAPSNPVKALYLEQFGFQDPGTELEKAQLESDRKAWQTFEALKGRTVDGGRLLQAMQQEPDQHAVWLVHAIPDPKAQTKILRAAKDFQNWFAKIYSQPKRGEDPSWAESYLEYQFACAVPADAEGKQQTVLLADKYHHGELDWYSFDLASGLQLQDKPNIETPAVRFEVETPLTFIPNPVEFPGMPNIRLWAFEKREVDFGNIQPSTTDLATLILAEFGLVYGNDWSLIPYRLDVGVLAEIFGIVVTDVFGVRTLVRRAVNSLEGEDNRWGMYYLKDQRGAGIDQHFFLPPVLGKMQESAPLEKVMLARDEIADMVWGIEKVIPSVLSDGIDGHEAAVALDRYLTEKSPPKSEDFLSTGALVRYRLGTEVYENWIPFIAIHNPGSNREIRLQRGRMPRFVNGEMQGTVEPRGAILRSGLDQDSKQPYFIHEEEVPRAGILITRTYQRARWWDGRIYTWLGRRKQTGRGRAASGLEFDRIVPLNEQSQEEKQ